MQLLDLAVNTVFTGFIMFCRIGSSFMLIPGIGEHNVPPVVKLCLALIVTILLMGVVEVANTTIISNTTIELLLLLCSEVLIGTIIGLVGRILFSAAHIAGFTISSHIGFSAAIMFDPGQGEQGSIIGNTISVFIITLLIVSNLHLVLIKALADSYNIMPFGAFFTHYNDFSALVTRSVVISWEVGMRFSAPFIIGNLVTYIGAGILSRLMPQLQIFFLILPAQILLGMLMLAITISAIMMWFIEQYRYGLGTLLPF